MAGDDDNLCIICFEKEANAVIMDCGHGGICYDCALENWKKGDNCVICRGNIEQIYKVANHNKIKISKVLQSTKKVMENRRIDRRNANEN